MLDLDDFDDDLDDDDFDLDNDLQASWRARLRSAYT